jgi:hypothetical protein
MGVIVHEDWDLSAKGIKDAERHREKIDDVIRKNIKDVIAEEAIITKKQGQKIRIPVRGLKDYKFIYGSTGASGGVGQGNAKAGDLIARRSKRGKKGDNKPGNQPGEEYMETEVSIDYLIELMFADLGLPWIKDKERAEQLVPKGWKFETISKVGIRPRVHKHRTLKETMKRMAMYAAEIMSDTECDEGDAYRALVMAEGDLNKAIDIAKRKAIDASIDPFSIFIEDDDLRFKQIEEDFEIHSNAVVLAMMDTSGSMTKEKKYLARAMLFWLVEFLKKTYNNVRIRFIVHTTEAKLVDEEHFFKRGEDGGTYCHTAIDLANELIENEYPVSEWNVYCVYISDGEDFSADETVKSVKQMLEKQINMLGYCEIRLNGEHYSSSNLLDAFLKEKSFSFKTNTENGTNFYRDDEKHFLMSVMKSKKDVYPCLRHLLFEKK